MVTPCVTYPESSSGPPFLSILSQVHEDPNNIILTEFRGARSHFQIRRTALEREGEHKQFRLRSVFSEFEDFRPQIGFSELKVDHGSQSFDHCSQFELAIKKEFQTDSFPFISDISSDSWSRGSSLHSNYYSPTFSEHREDSNSLRSPVLFNLFHDNKELVYAARLQQTCIPSNPEFITTVYEAVTPTFPKPRITSEFVISLIPRATRSTFSHGEDPWQTDDKYEQQEVSGAGFAQGRPWTEFTNLCACDWANSPCSTESPELPALHSTDVHRDLVPIRAVGVNRAADVHRDPETIRVKCDRIGEGLLRSTEGDLRVEHGEAAPKVRDEKLSGSILLPTTGHQALPRPDTQV
jgi:hypothetical protein